MHTMRSVSLSSMVLVALGLLACISRAGAPSELSNDHAMTQMRERCNLVFSGKADLLASKLHLQV